MDFIIAGKSNIAAKALLYLYYNYNDIINIYVLPSKSDLDDHEWQLSLKKIAKQIGVNIIDDFTRFYDKDDVIVLSLEYDKIIKVNNFKSKQIYNIHFSYLPYYRGVYTSIFPILNNESYSGVTLHIIDEGIDTGDIIDQIKFNIKNYTAWDLYNKYNYYAYELLKKNIDNIIQNKFKTFPQDNSIATYYSRKDLDFTISNIKHEDLFKKDAEELYKIMRAFYFPVYQFPKFNGIEIVEFDILDDKKYNYDIGFNHLGENYYILKPYKGKLIIKLV